MEQNRGINKDSALIKNKDFWYLVGLITADGSLSKDGRHISITSSDKQYLEALKRFFNFNNKIGVKNKNRQKKGYHIQLTSKFLWNFLRCVGLMPQKTYKLISLNIPCAKFSNFLRGFIDGDGNIHRWANNKNGHTQWCLRMKILSGAFAKWLCKAIEQRMGAKGRLHLERKKNRRDIFVLKFGKLATQRILKMCYHGKVFALERKYALAEECLDAKTGWTRHRSITAT